ncbi:MAG: hypothetical protein LBH00_00965, partial [Planctomycetaceae bacterium]|nr:hypothetical protein [Planctomycetaceae bacterium]
GIEFYSWDFSYDDATQQFKADVIFDKEGHQIQSFKTGEHTIAVKVVDNEGMENIETVKIKLNGAVKIL